MKIKIRILFDTMLGTVIKTFCSNSFLRFPFVSSINFHNPLWIKQFAENNSKQGSICIQREKHFLFEIIWVLKAKTRGKHKCNKQKQQLIFSSRKMDLLSERFHRQGGKTFECWANGSEMEKFPPLNLYFSLLCLLSIHYIDIGVKSCFWSANSCLILFSLLS